MSKTSALKVLPVTEKANNRSEVFRQTRYVNESSNVFVMLDNKKGKVLNWSRTGVAFEVDDKEGFQKGEAIENVKILNGSIAVFEGDIVIHHRDEKDGKLVIGAAFASSLFLVEGMEAAAMVNDCSDSLNALSNQVAEVDPQFFKEVVGLASTLRKVKRTCDIEEKRWRELPFDRRCEAERVFLPNMSDRLKAILTKFNKNIAEIVDVEQLPSSSIYHEVFNEQIYPFFEGANFIRRAYEKPRGYAGDYEMMNQIYRDGYEGDTLFGRVLHNYAIGESSSESVKFRKPYFLGFYESLLSKPGSHSVLSLASGPAVEVQEFIKKHNQEELDSMEISLFDLDREALEHAQSQIYKTAKDQNKNPRINFINASVKSFLIGGEGFSSKYDYIYSGGLFDYLDNVTSAALVRNLSKLLNPGGIMVIGNFTHENTTKAFCHLMCDWSLIHKSEAEMRDWAQGVEGVDVQIEYDEEGINAFLVLRK